MTAPTPLADLGDYTENLRSLLNNISLPVGVAWDNGYRFRDKIRTKDISLILKSVDLENDHQGLVRAYLDGETIHQMSQRLGCSEAGVRERLKALRFVWRRRGKALRDITPEMGQRIATRYLQECNNCGSCDVSPMPIGEPNV